ncbi:unnamed protein product, partial [Ilex paraguariensis]
MRAEGLSMIRSIPPKLPDPSIPIASSSHLHIPTPNHHIAASSLFEAAQILTSEARAPSYVSFFKKPLHGRGIPDTQSSKTVVAKPTKRVISHNGETTMAWTREEMMEAFKPLEFAII